MVLPYSCRIEHGWFLASICPHAMKCKTLAILAPERRKQSKTYPVTILSVPVLQKWTDVESQQGLLVPDTIMVRQMPKEHISWSLAFVTPSECSLKFIFSHKFLNITLNRHESCCIGSCFLTAGLRAIATMVAPASRSLFILNFFRM